MLLVVIALVSFTSRKKQFVRLKDFLKNCPAFLRYLVLDYRLASPRLLEPHDEALLYHVVDDALVFYVVQAAIAHQLALVQLAVLGQFQYHILPDVYPVSVLVNQFNQYSLRLIRKMNIPSDEC